LLTRKTKKAGLGVFAGTFFKTGELVGRVGDAAFPTVDQNWHLSSEDGSMSKAEGDFHWPLANYDWNAPDIGCEWEAEDISVTVAGFGGENFTHYEHVGCCFLSSLPFSYLLLSSGFFFFTSCPKLSFSFD
jgi:hypothetical protein